MIHQSFSLFLPIRFDRWRQKRIEDHYRFSHHIPSAIIKNKWQLSVKLVSIETINDTLQRTFRRFEKKKFFWWSNDDFNPFDVSFVYWRSTNKWRVNTYINKFTKDFALKSIFLSLLCLFSLSIFVRSSRLKFFSSFVQVYKYDRLVLIGWYFFLFVPTVLLRFFLS